MYKLIFDVPYEEIPTGRKRVALIDINIKYEQFFKN